MAIPMPDPTPERKANRANRKDASIHATMAPIAKHSSIHVKGQVHMRHMSNILSGAADDGSIPDFNRRARRG